MQDNIPNVRNLGNLKTCEESKNLPRIPRPFYNSAIEGRLEEGRRVNKKRLTNILNYINFHDGSILLIFRHQKYGKTISLNARPQACLGDTLDCCWLEGELNLNLASYQFQYFLIVDTLKMILVKAELKHISASGISFNLPEACYEIDSRRIRRHSCEDIQAEIIQNGVMYRGLLLDFSINSFRVQMPTSSSRSLINPECTVDVIFRKKEDISIFRDEEDFLYTGGCRIIRQAFDLRRQTLVLEPLNNAIRRVKPKEYRSLRQRLSPSPTIVFTHPFTRRMINLKVIDLSTSGFSVEEDGSNSVIFPGMIIPVMEIDFASGSKISCKAQVMYRNASEDEKGENRVKCGLTILEMDMEDHTRLSALLHQAKDENSYLCNRIDADSLWSFLFETGFIYPKKYASIQGSKEKLKENLERLYTQDSNIARHFIYQEKGQIYGHMSMIRFYENSWMIHHHAARASEHIGAGVKVLKQIGRYAYDFCSQYADEMNFLICYFRPENKFPNRIFGGFARYVDNPKISSVDPFAYFFHQKTSEKRELSGPWTLTGTQGEDLFELAGFYENESGGLMLKALDLEPGAGSHALNQEYKKLGLKRERHLFSLKRDGVLKAIFMVSVSDIGLNLSDLTNCIHALIIEPDDLHKEILNSTLSLLSGYYGQEEIPVLLYPQRYTGSQSIPCEKVYHLWVLDTRYSDTYFSHIEDLFTETRGAGERTFGHVRLLN